jgi:hypothetical protein
MTTKLNWKRLTKAERREYMSIQMARSTGYGGGGYLPDDCSECGACGESTLGIGLCGHCSRRHTALWRKLKGEA